MLEMTAGEIKKFEIFVTPLFDGFICDNGFTPDLKERKSVISQLLNGLKQLKDAKKCHKIFHQDRQPGKEDMYSVGWLILRLLCDDENLFFCLRDNYVVDTTKTWMAKFRNLPEIEFVMKMINIKNQPTVEAVINEWNKISSKITLIHRSKLFGLGVPKKYLRIQYVHSK